MSTTTQPEDVDHTGTDQTGTGQAAPSDVGPEQALRAAKPPVGSGLSPVFGQLVAVLLIAVGVVAAQEAVQRTGLARTSWTSWLLTRADGRTASFAMVVLSVVLVLVGLALLVVVFRPRPRRTLSLTATTGVFLRTGDLARLARGRVDGADGVTDVGADATRRRLTVHLRTVAPVAANQDLEEEVERRVGSLFDALESRPRLVVTIDNQDLT